MRRCLNILASLMILFTAVSCSKELDFGFKDLCLYHPHTAPVQINVDWSKFNHIEKPTGMTIYTWPHSDDEDMQKFLTHDLSHITLNLKAGKFDAFVFNQSDTEYSTLEFHNLENFDLAEVRVRQTKASSWYKTKDDDTRVGDTPEWFALDCLRDIDVTEEMVEIAEKEYLASFHAGRRGAVFQNELATLQPRSIIKSIDIYIHLERVPFLRSALGALEHMAEGCYISTGKTTEREVTHTTDKWELIFEKDENGNENVMNGAIKTTISTFGLPSTHTGKPEDTNLYVKLLLVDNETILTMNFPLGEILANLNSIDGSNVDKNGKAIWPEVHVYWPEPLPEVRPVGSGDGGFNVGVGDWGDEVVTVLPVL